MDRRNRQEADKDVQVGGLRQGDRRSDLERRIQGRKEGRMSRYVDLDESVTAQFYDQEYEEWTMRTVTIEDVLDSVCDDYTILPSAEDTISRQAAIDALDGEIEITGRTNAEAVKGYARLVRDRLERLPAAQPDEAKVLAEILDGCTLTYPCDKLWSPDGWCKDHCKDNYKEPSAECWLKYAEVVVSDSTDTR